MRYFFSKPKNTIAVLVVITVLAALIISLFQTAQNNRPAYIETEPPPSSSVPMKTADDYQLTPYIDDENHLALYVPKGWTKAIQNGMVSFVNATDGSTMYVALQNYSPVLSNMTADTLQTELAAQSGTLLDFQSLSNCSYSALYTIENLTYMVYTEWSFDKVLCLTVSLQNSVYDYYRDGIQYVFDNVEWQKEQPVPKGYMLYYNSFGNFEFGVPSDWTYSIEDGSLFLSDKTTNSLIGISAVETAATFEGVSQITFANVMGQGKNNFILRNYTNSGTIIQAEASYINNGQTWIMVEKILCNGQYQYTFAFTCPEENYQEAGQVFDTVTNLFRTFE